MKRNFYKLKIWKRSRNLVKLIYSLTSNLPSEEKFVLTSQLRRAAISVPSNIAEECDRNHDKEVIQFLYISIGSLCEIETQLYLLIDLKLHAELELEGAIDEVVQIRKMIYGYIKTI